MIILKFKLFLLSCVRETGREPVRHIPSTISNDLVIHGELYPSGKVKVRRQSHVTVLPLLVKALLPSPLSVNYVILLAVVCVCVKEREM